jgi:hypothetical protein
MDEQTHQETDAPTEPKGGRTGISSGFVAFPSNGAMSMDLLFLQARPRRVGVIEF